MSEASLSLDTVIEIRDTCLCLASQRAARRLARRFDRAFMPVGLTNGQFSILVALSGRWQPRLGELAAFLAMDTTTMSAAIKPLARDGLVALTADATDRRVRRPAITDAGRARLADALPIWRAEHAQVQASLAPHDPLQIARLIGGIGQD